MHFGRVCAMNHPNTRELRWILIFFEMDYVLFYYQTYKMNFFKDIEYNKFP